jgi:hypothetical protein
MAGLAAAKTAAKPNAKAQSRPMPKPAPVPASCAIRADIIAFMLQQYDSKIRG